MKTNVSQLPLPGFNVVEGRENGVRANRLEPQDRAFHDWYRFVLAFPPHLVRQSVQEFGLDERQTVLDPFCGTGTTLVEARLMGVPGVGLEANPFAHFASSVKLDWALSPEALLDGTCAVAEAAWVQLAAQGIDDDRPFRGHAGNGGLRTLAPDAEKLLITNSISPLPLHKTLVLLECLRLQKTERYFNHALLALANALILCDEVSGLDL